MKPEEVPVDSVVLAIAGRLNREGLRAWLDRKPPPGSSWRDFFDEEPQPKRRPTSTRPCQTITDSY